MKNLLYKLSVVLIIFITVMQLYSLGNRFVTVNAGEKQHETVTAPQVVTETEVLQYLPERIVINAVGIDLPVVYQPLVDGTWQVAPKAANFAEGTSYVNEKEGNVGLFGHARSDAFLRIKELTPGDIITIYMKDHKAAYRVIKTDAVTPDTVNVFYPEKSPVLTLITCEGRFDEKRFMVRAELLGIETYE
jgi:LPXTG-site transpeptidase (sortase) family protein